MTGLDMKVFEVFRLQTNIIARQILDDKSVDYNEVLSLREWDYDPGEGCKAVHEVEIRYAYDSRDVNGLLVGKLRIGWDEFSRYLDDVGTLKGELESANDRLSSQARTIDKLEKAVRLLESSVSNLRSKVKRQ